MSMTVTMIMSVAMAVVRLGALAVFRVAFAGSAVLLPVLHVMFMFMVVGMIVIVIMIVVVMNVLMLMMIIMVVLFFEATAGRRSESQWL